MMVLGHAQMRVARALADGSCLTTAALAAATGYDAPHIRRVSCRLIRRGWVERREAGCFRLSELGALALAAGAVVDTKPIDTPSNDIPRRPRRKTQKDRIWKAMRVLGRFTIEELMAMSGVKRRTVMSFLQVAGRAGYLAELRREPSRGPNRPGHHRYLLADDPGPATPIQRANGDVFDPNSGSTRPRRPS